MKKRSKKLLALLLTLALAMSLTACSKGSDETTAAPTTSSNAQTSAAGSESETEGTTAANNGELTTITLYPAAGNISSGVIGGYKGEYFASLGLQVEVWAFSDEKTNAILASGDLPDILYVPEVNRDDMIESGMLLQLDDYLDQMPHVQAFEEMTTAINYVKEYKSAGTGKLYGLPTSVGDTSTRDAYLDSTERNCLRLKWDVYEEIGAPEIKNENDIIDVMEKMVAAHPTDEDGTPFYGTILNNGSDSTYFACMQMWDRWHGYDEWNLPYMLETNMAEGTTSSILEKDSMYYKGLKWYNEVYRRGLMDPDSINNDRPTQKVKVDAGYAMIPSGNLPGWAPGYLEYYIPDSKIYYSYESPYGGQLLGINANTENLDACLKFLDMLADPDAYLWIIQGPDGEYWESDDQGNAMLTEAAKKHLEVNGTGSTSSFELSTGEPLELWNTAFLINTGVYNSYTDGEGNYRTGRTSEWKEVCEMKAQNETFQKWIKTTGYNTWKEWLGDNYVSDSALTGVQPLCTLPDPTMQLTVDALKDTVVNASWKMVYANSDEEFESIWDEMVADCEGLDAQSIIDWRTQDLENAKAIKASLESGN